ncbi:MAG: hypothetical protein ACHQUB_01720 [Candidatus Saccharimonadia bacterium]
MALYNDEIKAERINLALKALRALVDKKTGLGLIAPATILAQTPGVGSSWTTTLIDLRRIGLAQCVVHHGGKPGLWRIDLKTLIRPADIAALRDAKKLPEATEIVALQSELNDALMRVRVLSGKLVRLRLKSTLRPN